MSQDRHRRTVAVVCLGLVVIIWITFGQTLKHDFVNYDDDAYVREAPEIIGGVTAHGIASAFTRTYVGNWQPLTTLSHMLDCQLFGLNAGGHHFTNVFLHSVSVLLLFLFLKQATGTFWRSAFVAALFAIHPLRVESVAWVAERKDVLSGLFFILTLLAYVRYARAPSIASYIAMSILYALGLMSKPMLVTVPFVLLLLDYWPLRRRSNWGKLFLEKIPFFVLAIISSIITLFAQTSTMQPFPFNWRIANAVVSIATYLGQFVWPSRLAVFYPHPHDQSPVWLVALSILLVLGISLAALALRRSRPYVLVGWLWYLGMLIPVLGLVQVGLQGHADRYTYLPSIGLGLLIAWGIVDLTSSWPYRRQFLSVAATIVLGALIWSASVQTSHWRDSKTLWQHALAVTSNNDVAHTNLGNFLPAREAIPHYEEALRIAPHTVLPLNNLAWIYATAPDPSLRDGAKAVELAREADRLSGGKDPAIIRNLAAAYGENGQFEEAVAAAKRALPLAISQHNHALAFDLRNNIDNYEKRIPIRDPSLANP